MCYETLGLRGSASQSTRRQSLLRRTAWYSPLGVALLQVAEEVVAQSALGIMEEFLDATRQFDRILGSTASERDAALFRP